MIKVNFSNPIIELNGKETIMNMWCNIICGRAIINSKKFNSKITLKDYDKYDSNTARLILQTTIEKEAYKWAYNKVSIIERNVYKQYTDADNFCRKAKHIIEHDETYINKLIQ